MYEDKDQFLDPAIAQSLSEDLRYGFYQMLDAYGYDISLQLVKNSLDATDNMEENVKRKVITTFASVAHCHMSNTLFN